MTYTPGMPNFTMMNGKKEAERLWLENQALRQEAYGLRQDLTYLGGMSSQEVRSKFQGIEQQEQAAAASLQARLQEHANKDRETKANLQQRLQKYAQQDREAYATLQKRIQGYSKQDQEAHAQLQARLRQYAAEAQAAQLELDGIKNQIVEMKVELTLQEVGYYQESHPLRSSVEYKDELKHTQQQIKGMIRNKTAISATTNWTVNGSQKQGNKMVADLSKLMLQAYNAEAENIVRTMKPNKFQSSVERLNKVRARIAKLGTAMDIEVTEQFHLARVQELRLQSDYLAKREEEKERNREERARIAEEKRIAAEVEKKRESLKKEQAQKKLALAKLIERGNTEEAAALREQIQEIETAMEDVERRAANRKAGYVYVISNIGAFGPNVVKIGLTRRLEPDDRIKELGDASVPFQFDKHLVHYSDDAVGLETKLHQHFDAQKVNLINGRKEFFYTTPEEVFAVLRQLGLTGTITSYETEAEALEYYQSKSIRDAASIANTQSQKLL